MNVDSRSFDSITDIPSVADNSRKTNQRATPSQKSISTSNLSDSGKTDAISAGKRPRNLPTGQLQPDSKRKPTNNKFLNVKGSGYSQRASSTKISAAKSIYSPDGRQRKKEIAEKYSNRRSSSASDPVNKSVVSSAQSFSNFVSSPFSSDSEEPEGKRHSGHSTRSPSSTARRPIIQSSIEYIPGDEAKYWKEQYQEERKNRDKLQVDLTNAEREFEIKRCEIKAEYDKELFKLKQENFVLSSKVDESRLKRLAELKQSDGTIDKEQVIRLETEIRDQETLLAGYQTENERIYEEMKQLRLAGRATEERMFRDNLKLKSELSRIRQEHTYKEELSHKDELLTNVSSEGQVQGSSSNTTATMGAGRIAQLDAELKATKMQEEAARNEINGLARRVDQLTRKLKEQEEELKLAKDCQSLESKQLDERYRKETEGLRKKLKWYAENQTLLDNDAEKWKQREEEMRQLRTKLNEYETAAGRKRMEMINSKKEKSQDMKRILDLERQVKEMENILKKRHPNSLPVLMWAASNNPNDNSNKSPSIEYLEGNIRKLEKEVEQRDQDGKRTLRAVEQKYNAMKLKYEERILELEGVNNRLRRDLEVEPPLHSNVLTIQRELDSVKERHRKETLDFEQNMGILKQEIQALRMAGHNQNKIAKELEIDLNSQDQDKQMLLGTVEKLQKDKQQLLADLRRMTERLNKATLKRPPSPRIVKSRVKQAFGSGDLTKKSSSTVVVNGSSLRTYEDDGLRDRRQYVPDVFTGAQVSEVVIENGLLKEQIEELQFQLDERGIALRKTCAEAEGRERTIREESEERIIAFKAAHQRELQKRLASSAYDNSASKVAELTSTLTTQEVIINHLKSQLAHLQMNADEVLSLRSNQTVLQTQLQECTDALHEAKKSHTPQLRHFEELLEKIRKMEMRHQQREQQLQQLLQLSNSGQLSLDVGEEATRWRKVVDAKNREIDRFRNELDAILNVLRELQRQGVVIPYRDATTFRVNSFHGGMD